jgi:hypothetical protein
MIVRRQLFIWNDALLFLFHGLRSSKVVNRRVQVEGYHILPNIDPPWRLVGHCNYDHHTQGEMMCF